MVYRGYIKRHGHSELVAVKTGKGRRKGRMKKERVGEGGGEKKREYGGGGRLKCHKASINYALNNLLSLFISSTVSC